MLGFRPIMAVMRVIRLKICFLFFGVQKYEKYVKHKIIFIDFCVINLFLVTFSTQTDPFANDIAIFCCIGFIISFS